MKKVFSILPFVFLFVLAANAQTKKNGMPDMRYKSNKEIYSTNSTTTTRRTTTSTYSPRPVYDGQTHTQSHGGSYPGSVNSHHKGGHYLSPKSTHVYGIHKTKSFRLQKQ